MTDSINRKMKNLRKQMMTVYFGILAAAALAVGGLFMFYEMRLKSLAGALYLADEESARNLFYVMFHQGISRKNLSAADAAVKACGYTENGFSYLFTNQGQTWLFWLFAAGLLLFAALGIGLFARIRKSDLYCEVESLARENRKLREELVTNVRYVEKRNRQLQDFTENIAHQVKMPLAGLSLSLDILKEEWCCLTGQKTLGEEGEALFAECFLHVSRIEEFIRRLLKISRMESGKVIFSHEEINLERLLAEAAAALPIEHKSVELDCPPHCQISGDGEWLMESFVNILGNCDEYIREKEEGKIQIRVLEMEEKYVVTVSDNGPGFGQEEIETIFDRFETRKDSNAFHVGIGLNLAKLVIEAHHGTIHAANSQELGGAEFRVVLPKYTLKKGKIILSS